MPSRLEDRFDKLRRLGEGGFGVVWRVRDRTTGHEYAAKVLKSKEGLRRFAREVKMARRYSKLPFVMPVVEHDLRASPPYFLMPLGTDSFKSWAGKMSEAQLLTVMRCLLHTLAAIHSDGGLHRDVKPDNLLLMPDGSMRLSDFGVGNNPNVTTNFTQTPQGTLSYMAPELFVPGQCCSSASDVFSAAVTWCHLATGLAPFGPQRAPTSLPGAQHAWANTWITAMTRPQVGMRPHALDVAMAIGTRLQQIAAGPQPPPEESEKGLENVVKFGLVVGGVIALIKAFSD